MTTAFSLRHALWLCLLLSWTLPAANNAVTGRIGTLGIGVEYAVGISDDMQWRFGINGGSHEFSTNDGGVDYNLKYKLRSADVLFDWHPFQGIFYTSIGVLYNRNQLDASAKSSSSVQVGNTTYPAGTNLTGKATFNTFSPYLGVGWGRPPSARGLIWMVDVGVVYQGAPKVKLQSNSGVSQSDLDREAVDLQNAINRYKYYPHVGGSFGFRF